MENIDNFSAEELQNCPYHQMLKAQASEDAERGDQHENIGDWGDIDDNDEDQNSPQRDENRGNDNSGGAGSTGSAATNN